MDFEPYIVYVRTDEQNRITSVNSSAFLKNADGWTEVDRGYGGRYGHAQSSYFDKPIMDERGVYRYRLVLGVPQERTQEDMDADYDPPIPQPSDAERIAQLEAALNAIEEGIASV